MRSTCRKIFLIVAIFNTILWCAQGEFLIDTSTVYGSAAMQQSNPSVSFNGTNYFVVWEDSRMTGAFHGDIFGARVSQSGSILDPASIFISENGWAPAVAFDGTNYFVVWSNNDIYGVRVDPSGLLIDTSRIIIATDSIPKDQPAVSFDGTNYLVIWSTYSELFCVRVSQGGVVLDSIPIHITSAGDYIRRPSVAYGDTCYLVVWSEYWGEFLWRIYGKRVNRDGVVLDTVPIWFDWAMNTVDPDVAFDGKNYLVVWERDYDIKGMRVNQAGALIDSSAIVVMEGQVPSVAFDGTNYLVVCDVGPPGKDIYGVRVDTSGTVVDTQAIAISTAPEVQRYPVVAFGATNYLVAWQDERNGSDFRDIYGTRVTQSGEVLDSAGIEISGAVTFQHHPAVAFDDTNYLIVWQDYHRESWDIYGVRMNSSSALLDRASAISMAGNHQADPAVVAGRTNFLVVWEDLRRDSIWDIYGARVDPSGSVIDTSGIPLAADSYDDRHPDVAFDGTNYLVVWEDSRAHPYHRPDIYGSLVDTSGIVLNEIAISATSFEQISPSISFDGANYFVVWRDARTGSDWNIFGSRIAPSGAVLDTGIAITLSAGWQYAPDVACCGTNYLVVWEDDRNGSDVPDIYGARVDTSGVVLDSDGIAIAVASGEQRYPVVAFDGTNYLVVWQDYRSDSTWDIYCAKVSVAGSVLSSYVVSTQKGNQLAPALVRGHLDELLVTYSGWVDSINAHPAYTPRIWGIFSEDIGIEENIETKIHTTNLGLQIYPSVLRRECNIRYTLSQKTKVTVSLYDVTGRLVEEIVNESQNSGVYEKKFNINDLPQGVYFVRLSSRVFSDTKKVIFVE